MHRLGYLDPPRERWRFERICEEEADRVRIQASKGSNVGVEMKECQWQSTWRPSALGRGAKRAKQHWAKDVVTPFHGTLLRECPHLIISMQTCRNERIEQPPQTAKVVAVTDWQGKKVRERRSAGQRAATLGKDSQALLPSPTSLRAQSTGVCFWCLLSNLSAWAKRSERRASLHGVVRMARRAPRCEARGSVQLCPVSVEPAPRHAAVAAPCGAMCVRGLDWTRRKRVRGCTAPPLQRTSESFVMAMRTS
eukprot:483488-Pleurochrysis_carterae.AAC.1